MAELDRFSAPDGPFALRFRREDLPGLLRKRLEVPQGALALVRRAGGEATLLLAGAETGDLLEGVLVKDQLRLALAGEAGRSSDDLAFEYELELVLKPRAAVIDLQQLERGLLRDRPSLSPAELQAWFEPHLREAVRAFAAGHDAEALARTDRATLETHLREQLQRALFESGLELSDLLPPRFSSTELETRRQAQAAAAEKARVLEKERELLEMKRRLDMEALLGDIQVKDEADAARKERRLARYEQLRSRMGEDDVKALIMLLDDDRQRARLIKELIDKDLSPAQRAAMKVSEMENAVEARLIELQQRMAQLTGVQLERRETDPITRRVLCVIGKRVLCFDPKTNLHPEVPKEVHETEKGALGYLRSVRPERVDGQDHLLMGAQRGVYRLAPDGKLHEYPFPIEPEGKGGANAVTYFDGRLFATHSELGLTEWPLAGGPGRRICEADTSGQSATRGAVVQDGVLYFSAGNDVLALDLATGSERPTRFRGSDDSITSFIVLPGELVAGNRSGRLFRWALDDPSSAEAFPVMKKNPIYMLRHCHIAGQGFFVIGSKDFTVTAAEPRKDLYREYQAREEVRWVDGAADYIVGVSRSGYKVFCWDAHRQTEPKLVIRVSDKVQDLFLVKMLPREAAV